MEQYNNIRLAVDRLLNIKSSVKRKKQAKHIQDKELFISVINALEMLQTRSNIVFSELKLDFSSYDETFFEIIDTLLLMHFGKDAFELISFYIWDKTSPDGTINEVFDDNDNIVPLNNATDLWNVVQKLTGEDKKWKNNQEDRPNT